MPGDVGAGVLDLQECYVPRGGLASGVLRVARGHWDEGRDNIQVDHAFTIIRFITAGCLDVLGDGPPRRVGSGILLAHPRGSSYHLRVPEGHDCRLWLVAGHGEDLGRRWCRQFGPGCFLARSCNPAEALSLAAGLLARAREADHLTPRDCAAYLDLLLLHCARSRAEVRDSTADRRFREAVALLDGDLHEDLPIQAVADRLGVNRGTLHRWFRDRLGISPLAYRQGQRLQRAALLLLHGNDRVQDIAAEVGFSCPFAFSKAFKRQFGMSPRRFRGSGG